MSTEKHAIPNGNIRCGKLCGIINDISYLSFFYRHFHGCVCGETWQRTAMINRTHGVCGTGVQCCFSENNKTSVSTYESPQSSCSSSFTNHIITDISIMLSSTCLINVLIFLRVTLFLINVYHAASSTFPKHSGCMVLKYIEATWNLFLPQ